MSFDQTGLSQPVLQALRLKNYTTPTPIQQQAIPVILEGRDILGIAQTGTGKTAAFMLPAIDRLSALERGAPKKSCRMLVLAPTRELVGQIAENAREYSTLSGLSVASIVGGTSVGKDRQKLSRGVDILIATPGRLVDLIDQKAFHLRGVEILVLDEADQMLDLGFIHALRKIVALLPERRQTLLFSATMPKSIKQLASQYLHDPATVSVTPPATTAERVDQYVSFINQPEKQALLTMLLRQGFADGDMDLVLVFTRTKHGADRVVRKLGQSGIPANAIHGNKSQPQRQRALDEFRKGKVRVLIATDIAARGIDIPGVSHVFNFELPNVPEQYVHRIGRTARAGATGRAVSFCAPDEREYLRDIQRLTKISLDKLMLPESLRAEVEAIAKQSPPPRRPATRSAGEGEDGEQRQGRDGRRPNRGPKGGNRGGPKGAKSGRFRGKRPQGDGQKPQGNRPNRRRRPGNKNGGAKQAAN